MKHRNLNWHLPDKVENWEQVKIALLMDIREELKNLNMKLACWRVDRMLDDVNRIDRRLSKRVKLK